MKRTDATQTQALRRQLARVLWRLRALERSRVPFDDVLGQLAAIKQQFGEVLRYVKIDLSDQETLCGRPVLGFTLDKEQFRRDSGHRSGARVGTPT